MKRREGAAQNRSADFGKKWSGRIEDTFDVEVLSGECFGYTVPGPVTAGQDEPRGLLIRHRLDRGQCLLVLGSDDHRYARLDDPGFLASDQIERVAE